uniref:HTH CENPB-type domain-containing protein n=1 Tax=Esox lucius TaxID=8010 RepID=A0A3P9AAF4_ESOLU
MNRRHLRPRPIASSKQKMEKEKIRKTRRPFTAGFKFSVIKIAKSKGNRAAGREFGVDESIIRRWRANEELLQALPRNKKANRGKKCQHPAIEQDLVKWIRSLRVSGRDVTTMQIRMKALDLAKSREVNSFLASPNWCFRFMQRHKLSIPLMTTVGQKQPEDWEEKMVSFRGNVAKLVDNKSLSRSKVGNMDEVPLTFDASSYRATTESGDTSVKVPVTTGNENNRFTVVLSCLGDGTKLPPMVIFRRVTMPREKLPKGIVVQCNKKGWMTEELMLEWANRVWRGRPGACFSPRGALILDSMSAHTAPGVKDHFSKTLKTDLVIIPSGLTCKLQPLEGGVNHLFRTQIRTEWEKCMQEGIHSFTTSGKMCTATFADVCQWVLTAWGKVTRETIVNSFRKTVFSANIEVNESEDDVDSDDSGCDPEAPAMSLFHSESVESDFDGFSESDL